MLTHTLTRTFPCHCFVRRWHTAVLLLGPAAAEMLRPWLQMLAAEEDLMEREAARGVQFSLKAESAWLSEDGASYIMVEWPLEGQRWQVRVAGKGLQE